MKVRILRDDPRLGILAGEIYEAKRYRYDLDKVTLLARIPDGYDPCCNQYKCDIERIAEGDNASQSTGDSAAEQKEPG